MRLWYSELPLVSHTLVSYPGSRGMEAKREPGTDYSCTHQKYQLHGNSYTIRDTFSILVHTCILRDVLKLQAYMHM